MEFKKIWDLTESIENIIKITGSKVLQINFQDPKNSNNNSQEILKNTNKSYDFLNFWVFEL